MNIFDERKRREMISRIEQLKPESRALWGKMNVHQMLCHCADGIKMATGEREVADKSSFVFRTVIKPLIIYVLPMPKSAPTAPEINPTTGGGSQPVDFESDRRILIECIEKMCGLPQDHAWARHAAFGKMSRNQWGRIAHKHLDHHLKQFGV